jgi:hypothetical protein
MTDISLQHLAGLELPIILINRMIRCWDYRCVSPGSVWVCFSKSKLISSGFEDGAENKVPHSELFVLVTC